MHFTGLNDHIHPSNQVYCEKVLPDLLHSEQRRQPPWLSTGHFWGKMTTCFHTQTRYHGTGIFTYSVTIYFSHSWIWGNIRSEHFSGFPDSLLMGILGPEATNQDFMAWLLGASPQLGYVVCGPWSISPLRIGMFPFQMAELHGL